MFTGIVEETGKIVSINQGGSSMELCVGCSFAKELALGESVAVNGTCLTVTKMDDSSFCADVTPESFRRTSLGSLAAGSIVNLERAMKADGRFGGHIVSGHVDGTGTFLSAVKEENAVNISFAVENCLGRYIIEKGSVCIDGISLTVASVVRESENTIFTVAVIPHTMEVTTLHTKSSGDKVNIECDIVGKYIEHFVTGNKDNAPLNAIMTDFTSFH